LEGRRLFAARLQRNAAREVLNVAGNLPVETCLAKYVAKVGFRQRFKLVEQQQDDTTLQRIVSGCSIGAY
jgi:hypothetical protein